MLLRQRFLILLFILFGSSTAGRVFASDAVPLAEVRANMLQKASERLHISPERFEKSISGKKMNRKMLKLAKRASLEIDFADPVDKWLWFGLFGLGAAIVLSIFSLGIGGLVAFLAVVCLVIWLVKQSGAV